MGYAFTSGIRRPAFYGRLLADCTGIDEPLAIILQHTLFSRIEQVGMAVTSQFIGGYLRKQFDVNFIPLYVIDKAATVPR